MFDHTDINEKHTDSNILNQSIQHVLIILITTKAYTDSNVLNYSIQYDSNILNYSIQHVRTILIAVEKTY